MCLGMWRGSDAYGAGRALPIKAENFVIKRFTRINPSLKWDPSNFLTDLAGIFANCKWIGTRGFKTVKRNTPEGGAIVAIVDYTSGSEPDAPSVTKYVRRVFKKWTKKSTYVAQIRKADLFGCAVRPACKGRVSVSCLFTSRRNFSTTTMSAPPTTSTQPPNPLTMTHRLETTTVLTPRVPEPPQRALAFTKEQYDLAENLTKTPWDRLHFLENLSGYETRCAMNGRKSWPFANARRIATEMGHKIFGLHKDAPNLGSTTDALRVILQSFKELPYAKKIGCSVIPDCMRPRRGRTSEMYVVVSCLYQEK